MFSQQSPKPYDPCEADGGTSFPAAAPGTPDRGSGSPGFHGRSGWGPSGPASTGHRLVCRPVPPHHGWVVRRLRRSRRGRPSPPRSRSGSARSPGTSSASGYSPARRPPPPGSPQHLEWKCFLIKLIYIFI